MALRDDLGDRMKMYETVPRTRLMRRMPVAVRIDMRAGHTFTKNFNRPFDLTFTLAMDGTMRDLCKNVQGCVFGYTQSDEITLILKDYSEFTSQSFFDYEVQKMCSILGSMATLYFNKHWNELISESSYYFSTQGVTEVVKFWPHYKESAERGAMFDARVWNIPREEVANLIYWRQLDAMRNSVNMCGQAFFSHKELQGKSVEDVKKMLEERKGWSWAALDTRERWGCCCVRNYYSFPDGNLKFEGSLGEWVIDYDMPLIKGYNREYVEQFLYANNEKTREMIEQGIV